MKKKKSLVTAYELSFPKLLDSSRRGGASPGSPYIRSMPGLDKGVTLNLAEQARREARLRGEVQHRSGGILTGILPSVLSSPPIR